MEISGSTKNSYYMDMFNMYTKKNQSQENKDEISKARKDDPVLDKALNEMDKARAYKDMVDTRAIASRIARGQYVSDSDKKLLQNKDSILNQKAQMAKIHGNNLKQKLKRAKTKQESRALLTGSTIAACSLAKTGDEAFGSLVMDATNEQSRSVKKKYPQNQYHKNYLSNSGRKKRKRIDVRR